MLALLLGGAGLSALFARCVLALGKQFSKTHQRLSGKFRRRAFFLWLGWGGAVLLVCALCLSLYVNAVKTRIAPAEELSGQTVRISGMVLDDPEESYHRYYYQIRVRRVTRGNTVREMDFVARLSTQAPIACEPYDTVECTAKLSAFDSSGGLYSGRNSYLARGIAVGGYLTDYSTVTVLPNVSPPWRKLLSYMRSAAGRVFAKHLPEEEAGLIRGILFGERFRIGNEIYGDFREIGASHLLVISGLHMSALVGLLLFFLHRLSLPVWLGNLVAGMCILLFLLVIGFPASAVRSGVMYLLALAASAVGRETDGVNSLGAAVLILCLTNPFSGGDLGLALSVFSTLGILLLGGRISRKLLAPWKRFPGLSAVLASGAASLGMTLSALLFTLPIQFLVFGGISLTAPVASLVLVLPCTLLLYCALFSVMFCSLPGTAPLAEPFLFCSGHLARFCIKAANWLARRTGMFLNFSRPAAPVLLIGALLLLLICCLQKNRVVLCMALAGILLLTVWGRALENGENDKIIFCAPSDLSCVVVMRGHRAAVLTTGGYQPSAAREILRKNNIRRVEALFLPVRNQAARETACGVLEAYSVDTLVLPEDAYLGRDLILAGQRAGRKYLANGEQLTLLEDVTVISEHDMGRLTFSGPAGSIMVETADTGAGDCQYLFTVNENSGINSSFTILEKNAIMELSELSPGRYLFPGEDGLYLELSPSGTVNFKGESVCLN